VFRTNLCFQGLQQKQASTLVATTKKMTLEERKILASKPISWSENISDGCNAKWAGLLLKVKSVDKIYFCCELFDIQKDESITDFSIDYKDKYFSKEEAKKILESVAKKYIAKITTRQEIAKYLISDTFIISTRGLVFSGYIKEGEVSIGDTIEFIVNQILYERVIIGIEGLRRSQNEGPNTGLIIKCNSEQEISYLANWNPNSLIAIVYKFETSANSGSH
jgi:hypothetical protein